MMTEQDPDEDQSDLRYRVRLLIHHPNMDPSRITKALGITPHLSVMAGGERRTRTGAVLPGPHAFSIWSYSFSVEGKRHFFSDVERMADTLEPHKDLLAEIDSSGGSINLIFDLPGDVNLGSELGWREMARLADLHVVLGIEVFPDFR